jgi:catechol 2,3-dioxygenase
MTMVSTPAPQAQTPLGIDHLVLNVRNIDTAHAFWTECLGFKQVGALRNPNADGRFRAKMRFYSGEKNGQLSHHDIALIEKPEMEHVTEATPQVFAHVAIAYPSREAWEAQIQFLLQRGVPLSRMLERGATCSIHLEDPDHNEIELVYQLPRERWEGDIDTALNHVVKLQIPA